MPLTVALSFGPASWERVPSEIYSLMFRSCLEADRVAKPFPWDMVTVRSFLRPILGLENWTLSFVSSHCPMMLFSLSSYFEWSIMGRGFWEPLPAERRSTEGSLGKPELPVIVLLESSRVIFDLALRTGPLKSVMD